MDNKTIAALFQEMAELLDIQGGQRYRARSFRRVAHVIEELAEPAQEALSFGTLQRRRGVGQGSIERIKVMLRTGTCRDLDLLRARMPSGVRELLRVDGLGPRSVRLIYNHLGVGSVNDLELAALTGRLARLPRFGARAAERILTAIADYRRHTGRTPLHRALAIGDELVQAMTAHPSVLHAELAGSARRRREMVGDLDVLVATVEPLATAERFCSLPQVETVLLRGEGRASVRLHSGQRADLRMLHPDTFGAGMHYFTGSKPHNIAIRVRGNRHGLKISEYGVFTRVDDRRLAGGAEVDIFAAVGLPFIPPELREDDGEIQAAERGALPLLVQQHQLRGDLNVHTVASDGRAPVRAMAEAAQASGLHYLAITDHSRSAKRRGLDEHTLLLQSRHIRQLDAEIDGIRLLAGVEVEILPGGELALDRSALIGLDWVVAAVHTELGQDRKQMTDRLIRAMKSGVVDCIAHPTGRILGQREPLQLDLGRLLSAARRNGVALEINGTPLRLDLDAASCRKAAGQGVLLAVNSGAHEPGELAHQRYALYTARRGWTQAHDLLNTRPVDLLLAMRRERMSRHRDTTAPQEPTSGAAQEPPLLDPLQLDLRPIPEELRDRLERWLNRPDDDPVLTDGLAERSDNPVRLAFELLWQREGSLD